MKPKAYMTKSGVLFKNEPDAPLELTPLYEMPKPLSDEEIVQLKAEIAAYKKTNELLAQKIEQLEKELSK